MSKLQEFLADYDNPSTRPGYQSAVYAFIKYVNRIKSTGNKRTTPEEKERYEEMIDTYLSETRDNKKDLMDFRTSMKGRPPLSQRQIINLVHEFLACNKIIIDHADLKRIRRKIKGGVVTAEKEFDIETIRAILRYMDIKGRSLTLTLLSSGMRIGETLQLRDSDINLKSVPAKISIRAEYTKTQQARITFITPQAVDALKEWLSVREDYLKSSNGKNLGLVKAGKSKERESNGDHIFPFSPNVANQMFENAVVNAGLMTKDERTKRSQIHLHMTRKFFISQMALLASSKEIPETLAGHGGNMTAAYRRYPVKQLAEEYLKVQHLLTITEEQELKAIEAGFKITLQKHDGALAHIAVENEELRKNQDALQQENAALTMRLQQIEQAAEEQREAMDKLNSLAKNLTPQQVAAIAKVLAQKKGSC
ncbi:tyrosine-type recombinase/integrase [Methanoregula sp.]|jgi:integrase|uniref:site-specific integrase n=1 Tax=Methanoregula sp. TaxID=2052170 RepID=UPI003C257967